MPFRCTQCEQLSATNEDRLCNGDKPCDFIRVSVLHWLTPIGEGRKLSTKRTIHMDNGNQRKISQPLNLACSTTKESPVATPYLPAVTCLSCLEFAEQHRPLKTEEDQ